VARGARADTIKVEGLRELNRDLKHAEKETQAKAREAAAEPVLQDWRRQLSPVHEKSASKLRARVRTGGVFILQTLRKTTGDRPDFAALQVVQGERALDAHAAEAENELEDAINELADIVEGRRAI
jgi:hypothetical protein